MLYHYFLIKWTFYIRKFSIHLLLITVRFLLFCSNLFHFFVLLLIFPYEIISSFFFTFLPFLFFFCFCFSFQNFYLQTIYSLIFLLSFFPSNFTFRNFLYIFLKIYQIVVFEIALDLIWEISSFLRFRERFKKYILLKDLWITW